MLATWKESNAQTREHIKNQRHYFAKKVPYSHTMVFQQSWRIDDFELWWWRRLLRVPWTARRFNLSILKEISPENSLQGLMLKLQLQIFGHLMWRTDSLEKTLMLGKFEGRKNRGRQRTRWLDCITDLDMNLSKLHELGAWDELGQGSLACCSLSGHK